MKYLHLVPWSPRGGFGGYETVIAQVAEYQAVMGHGVVVMGRREGERHETLVTVLHEVTYIEAVDRFRRCPSTLSVGWQGFARLLMEIIFSWIRLSPILYKTVKKNRTDAVIFYGIHLFPLGFIVRLAGSHPILGLETIQKNPSVPKLSWLGIFRRFKYSFFDGIFAYTKQFYLANGNHFDNVATVRSYAGSTPVAYIPWGIDIRKIASITADLTLLRWKHKTDTTILICPRRLVEEKGVRYLLEAIPAVRKRIPNIQVLFTSDGVLRHELERRTKELHLEDNVRFTGVLPHTRILRMMKASDMVVVPSSGEESFGMVFLEAYALHVPIITTWFGGIPNVVHDDMSGILVAPKDSASLGRAIVALLNNPGKQKRLIAEGQRLLDAEFNVSTTLQRLDAFIREIRQGTRS